MEGIPTWTGVPTWRGIFSWRGVSTGTVSSSLSQKVASLCEALQRTGPGLCHNTVCRVTGQLQPWLNSHQDLPLFSWAATVDRVATLVPRALHPPSLPHKHAGALWAGALPLEASWLDGCQASGFSLCRQQQSLWAAPVATLSPSWPEGPGFRVLPTLGSHILQGPLQVRGLALITQRLWWVWDGGCSQDPMGPCSLWRDRKGHIHPDSMCLRLDKAASEQGVGAGRTGGD